MSSGVNDHPGGHRALVKSLRYPLLTFSQEKARFAVLGKDTSEPIDFGGFCDFDRFVVFEGCRLIFDTFRPFLIGKSDFRVFRKVMTKSDISGTFSDPFPDRFCKTCRKAL